MLVGMYAESAHTDTHAHKCMTTKHKRWAAALAVAIFLSELALRVDGEESIQKPVT